MVLLAAAAGILYRLPVSLQDVNRVIQLAVGKFSHVPVQSTSPDEPLRGTIYDRHYRELAVSYQVFSLFVHPAKIPDHQDVAGKLAEITGVQKETLEKKLKQSLRVVELADDLDADQVEAILQLQLEGVYCQSSEERFYPEHTAAAHVLGYTSEGLGLSGMEGKYDPILHPGECKAADVPGIDFQGRPVLGQQSMDLTLTLDIELQRAIDNRLQEVLREQGGAQGMALLLNPATGEVLALSNQPSFNPNYFWRAKEEDRKNKLYTARFDPDMVRPFLLPTAARIANGEQFSPLLPQTIAARDFGLSENQYDGIIKEIGFLQSVPEDLPSEIDQSPLSPPDEAKEMVSVMQLGVGLASLVNGGWRIAPVFFDSAYDLQSSQRVTKQDEANVRSHVLSPAMGVIVRRELLSLSGGKGKGKPLTLFDKRVRVVNVEGFSEYVQQQLFVGMVPVEKPELLLVLAIEHSTLAPFPKEKEKSRLSGHGESLLVELLAKSRQEKVVEHPVKKNPDNLAQFLISRRVEYTPSQTEIGYDVKEMPKVTGLSLRKGLQRLNQHNLRITIKGSGRIVSQSPAAGDRLADAAVCLLTLQSEI